MRARIVTLADVGEVDYDRWRDLADRAIEPNAFLDPRFLVPGGHPNSEMRDKRFLFIEDGDRLLAVMGFEVHTQRIFRIPMRVMRFASWDYSTRRYPLVDPDRPVEALEALLRPPGNVRLPRVLELEFFPGSGPLHDALLAAAEALNIHVEECESLEYAYCFFTERSDEVPAKTRTEACDPSNVRQARIAVQHLSSRTRRRFESFCRRLEEQSGTRLTISDRGADPAAITDFLDFQASGWKGDASRGGIAFRVTGDDLWFTKATDAFRESGALSVFTLSTPTATIYMAVVLRSGEVTFGAQDAYNEDLSQFRAGSLGRLAILEYLAAGSDTRVFDPNMRPSYVDSTSLYPDRRRYTRFVVFSRVPFARLALRTSAALRRARSVVGPS